jgi:hypothetical protein
MEKIGIIIPTKDRPRCVENNLQTLSDTNHECNVYLMCDSSGTLEENTKLAEKYQNEGIHNGNIIVAAHNEIGLAGPLNKGLELALADNCSVLITVDDDLTWQEPPEHIRTDMSDDGYLDVNQQLTPFNILDWPKYLLEVMPKDSPERIVFFCKPDRPSAMAFRKEVIEMLAAKGRPLFDNQYPTAYWLDDDWMLELAGLSNNQPMRLIEDKDLGIIRNWVTHAHSNEGSQWPRNASENMVIFNNKWVRVDSDHPLARLRKGSADYYALRHELENL